MKYSLIILLSILIAGCTSIIADRKEVDYERVYPGHSVDEITLDGDDNDLVVTEINNNKITSDSSVLIEDDFKESSLFGFDSCLRNETWCHFMGLLTFLVFYSLL